MDVALELFKDALNTKAFIAGETIFEQDQPGDFMYVILEGEVEICCQGLVVSVLSRGEIFGEMALIDDSPRAAMAVARTDCRVVLVDRYNFIFYVEHSPMFALQVMSVMANRLRQQIARPQRVDVI